MCVCASAYWCILVYVHIGIYVYMYISICILCICILVYMYICAYWYIYYYFDDVVRWLSGCIKPACLPELTTCTSAYTVWAKNDVRSHFCLYFSNALTESNSFLSDIRNS